jgi:site-specific recombinase XerD
MPGENTSISAHITAQTPLLPAIRAWEIYLQDQSRSIYTIKAFRGDMELLCSYLPPDRTTGAVTTAELNNFLLWLQNGRNVPCSPKSLSRRITSIKAFFRWLHRSGVLADDSADKIVQQSVISPLPIILSLEEEQKVIDAALHHRKGRKPDARPYTLLALLLATGIKKGECLTINLNHIALESPPGPILFVRYSSPQNRYKERKIPLPSDWLESYEEYLAQYRPNDRIFPWSPRRLEYLLEDLGKEAGLSKHLSFDMCRWTCALDDWRSDMERDKIRAKLGISKIQWREISMKLRQLSGDNDSPNGAQE